MIPCVYVEGRKIDLAGFGVQHLVKNYQFPEVSPVTIATGGMLSPLYVRTEAGQHGLELKLWLQGDSKGDTMKKTTRLAQVMQHCEIVFDAEPDLWYSCTLQSVQSESSTSRRMILILNMACDILSRVQTVTITQTPQIITIPGARKTNLNIEIKALNALTDYQINDMRVTCAKGDTLYIDSENGLADLTRIDLIQFPQAVGDYAVSVSNLTDAAVKISYRARW